MRNACGRVTVPVCSEDCAKRDSPRQGFQLTLGGMSHVSRSPAAPQSVFALLARAAGAAGNMRAAAWEARRSDPKGFRAGRRAGTARFAGRIKCCVQTKIWRYPAFVSAPTVIHAGTLRGILSTCESAHLACGFVIPRSPPALSQGGAARLLAFRTTNGREIRSAASCATFQILGACELHSQLAPDSREG
jgi:hypothetical protein